MAMKIFTAKELEKMDLNTLLDQLVIYTGLYTNLIKRNGFKSSGQSYRDVIKSIQDAIEDRSKKAQVSNFPDPVPQSKL
jgi:hypothetical protein